MVDLSNKTCLVLDLGIFTEMAARLARDFGRVLYYVPWQEAFPKSHKALIGHDFDGIERVTEFWSWVDRVDCIFSPDVYSGDVVEFLRGKGYPVAGCGQAEKFEKDREWARTIQAKEGLPTQETVIVEGVSGLRKYLKDHKNRVVKINIYRGDVETFHAPSLESVEMLLDQVSYEYGPAQEELTFVVEKEVGESEPGFDGIVCDGRWLSPTMYGYEMAPAVYLGRVVPYTQLPQALWLINDKLGPYFRGMRTRGFISTEIRLGKDKKGYLIDLTIRHGAPGPAAVQSELIENYSEVVWGLAHGEPTAPEMNHLYGGALALGTDWAEQHWVKINFPQEMRQWIKLRRAAKFDGQYYAVPGMPSVCTVIDLGNDVQTILEHLKEKSEEVQFYGEEKPIISTEKILEQIENGRKLGIEF